MAMSGEIKIKLQKHKEARRSASHKAQRDRSIPIVKEAEEAANRRLAALRSEYFRNKKLQNA